jgi:hypothetical protein
MLLFIGKDAFRRCAAFTGRHRKSLPVIWENQLI